MQQPPRVDLSPWFLTFDDFDGPIDFRRYFGNDHPVEVDVGCGRGLFLFNASETHPQTNYLGIEIDYHEARRAAHRLQKRQTPNARILGGDVSIAFGQLIPAGSVAAVHVYFPDPWWKKKHKKRRVFTDQLVDQMTRVLQPGGLVHSWTDVADYFEVIGALMDHDPRFETLPVPEEHSPEHDLDYQTSFERKKRKAGCPIYRGRWRLRQGGV